MMTQATIKQLEKRYNRVNNKGNVTVVRQITQDGKLIDPSGFEISEETIERITKEDEKVIDEKGLVVYLINYAEPKIRTT